MNRVMLTAVAVVAAALLVVVASSVFVVSQTQQALVLQFGEPKKVIRDPGLNFKLPFVQNVVFYDRRVLDYEPVAMEVIAADQKRLVVDTYARFRIVDPLQFYRSVRNEQSMRNRLDATISASLRRALGNVILATMLSPERARIMTDIRDDVNEQSKSFGIEVLDVRIRRADLPAENSQAIFQRMESEREREAKEFRAEGAEIAQRIRARADRERTVIIAEATKEAQITRGQGDADSVKIYADAFGQDKDFFTFYRSMQAYRQALGDGTDTTMVLSPDSGFFRYFGAAPGGPSSSKPAP